MLPLKPFIKPCETEPIPWRRRFVQGLTLLGCLGTAWAQPETDIFLVPLWWEGGSVICGAAENLTQNPGYDNQPAFTADGALLYASTRDGQTDIARLDLASRELLWLSDTPGGGEYSPLPIPGRDAVSAIRLDTTGLQRLYEYQDGESRLILADLRVGYQVWAGPGLLVCSVLVDGRMDLVLARPESGSVSTLGQRVGRSLQNIPGMDLISYTAPSEEGVLVKSIHPVSGASEVLTTLPGGVEDLCWLPDGSLLCGGDGELRRWVPGPGANWQVVHTFGPGFGKISRLAVNENGTLLALVAESNP